MSYKLTNIDIDSLQNFDQVSKQERELISEYEINTQFNTKKNFVEINFLSTDGTLILSDSGYNNYKILREVHSSEPNESSAITVSPIDDIKAYLLDGNNVKVLYNFLNNLFTDLNSNDDFIVKEISGDRTELRLKALDLSEDEVRQGVSNISNALENNNYFSEFSIYLQNNTFLTATNIKLSQKDGETYIDIKLYNSAPESIDLNKKVSIVEEIANPVAFLAEFKTEPVKEKQERLRGPNFSIEVEEESNEQSQYLNFDELFSTPSNNSTKQINSLLKEKSAELSINYKEFEDFINFSSAEERLLNFKYKLQLIEKYEENINALNQGTVGDLVNSVDFYQTKIDGIVENFDHYERHLYYSNDNSAWPKTDTSLPYTNAKHDSTQAINWFDEVLSEARIFDNTNFNILTNTVPTYLKDSGENDPYITFVHMIAHHFDNLWIYTKAVSDKYDNDNRVNKGVSKDLIEEVLKNFGIKLYSNSRSIEDLFRYFTVDSYDPNGEVINETEIVGDSISQKDYYKEIYKRIYHNLPLLLKAKGTERGVRALINCFGIPSEILSIKLYGGDDNTSDKFLGEDVISKSSLDKIRLNNTGTIVEGNTLSQYTSIQKGNKNFTNDSHKAEIGFSPTDNLNEYIKGNLDITFNIDNYIGDPRSDSNTKYPDLERLYKEVVPSVDKINIKEYVRLLKFFDNTLFKMVEDFLPARTVTNTGLVIKPHVLNRSVTPDVGVGFTQDFITGSVETGFATGSDGGAYSNGKNEYSTNHKNYVQTPNGKIVKSWRGANGHTQYHRSGSEAKFDGELKNSEIEVTNGELNEDNPFKQIRYYDVVYDMRFLSYVPAGLCQIYTKQDPTIFKETDNTVNLTSVDLTDVFGGYTSAYKLFITGSSGTVKEVTSDSDAYDITVDVPTSNNYGTVGISVRRDDIDTPPPENPDGTECVLSASIQVIHCKLSADQSQIDLLNPVNQFTAVDLTAYTNGLNVNTNRTFYEVKSDNTTQEITTPSSYKVIDNTRSDYSNLVIRVTDNVDTNCTTDLTFQYTTCPLDIVDNISPTRSYTLKARDAGTASQRNLWNETNEPVNGVGYYLPDFFTLPTSKDPRDRTGGTTDSQYDYARYFTEIYRKGYTSISGDTSSQYTLLGTIYSNYSGNQGETTYDGLESSLANYNPAFITVNDTQSLDSFTYFRTSYFVPTNYNDILAKQGTFSQNSTYVKGSYLHDNVLLKDKDLDAGADSFFNENMYEAALVDGSYPGLPTIEQVKNDFDNGPYSFAIRLGLELGNPDKNCRKISDYIDITNYPDYQEQVIIVTGAMFGNGSAEEFFEGSTNGEQCEIKLTRILPKDPSKETLWEYAHEDDLTSNNFKGTMQLMTEAGSGTNENAKNIWNQIANAGQVNALIIRLTGLQKITKDCPDTYTETNEGSFTNQNSPAGYIQVDPKNTTGTMINPTGDLTQQAMICYTYNSYNQSTGEQPDETQPNIQPAP